MIAAQLMSRYVVTCRPEDSLHDAARKMWEQDIGCLPVIDADGHVVGIVTDRDICMAAFTQGKPITGISVESAMLRRVFSCLPGDSVAAVETVMKERQVHRLPVIDEGHYLLGIVSTSDIVRESARELKRRTKEIPASECVDTLATVCRPRHQALSSGCW